MRNFSKIIINHHGHFKIIGDDGSVDASLNRYLEYLISQKYSATTIKRYLEVVSVFLDYLSELGVYPVARDIIKLNNAIQIYCAIRQNPAYFRSFKKSSEIDGHDIADWAPNIISTFGYTPIESQPLTAPLNLFLRLSNSTQRMDREPFDISQAKGGIVPEKAFELSPRQMYARRSKSIIAGNIRTSALSSGGRISAIGGRAKRTGGYDKYLDFPVERLPALLNEARSQRDRLFWVLLASTGLRSSEALNITWAEISFERQAISAPDLDRLAMLGVPYLERDKGRTTRNVAIIPVLKRLLFDTLVAYRQTEYQHHAGHPFVLQDILPGMQGRPYHLVSDTGRLKSFKAACKRATIIHPSPGGTWVLHSLRHLFGVYMLNYIPVPGGYGLSKAEVQYLMGHQSITSTDHYAREDRLILEGKLIFAELQADPARDGWRSLPEHIAARYIAEAARLTAS